jgi:fibrillarin-like pre-rRNA processing protein
MVELKNSKFENVFFINDTLCTRNLTPGNQVYGEDLINIDGEEFRTWNPKRSKLAALILNGCEVIPISQKSKVLYLGAGNGTTVSHVSDIAPDGSIYSIEFSPRAFRDLLNLARVRKNVFPVLEDVFHPERYSSLVGKVDVIYQDVSQRDQSRAFKINAEQFLNSGGYGILMIKSRSIDMTKPPDQVYRTVIFELENEGFKIIEKIKLDPYSKDHLGLVLKFE